MHAASTETFYVGRYKSFAVLAFPQRLSNPFINLIFFLFNCFLIKMLPMIYKIACGKCGYFNGLKFVHFVINV